MKKLSTIELSMIRKHPWSEMIHDQNLSLIRNDKCGLTAIALKNWAHNVEESLSTPNHEFLLIIVLSNFL